MSCSSLVRRASPLLVSALVALGVAALAAPRAEACGGFFCSSPSLPVNQSAERIIFSQNGDGTVTAVVQILYSGPAESFSWFLPVPGVPNVDVSSNLLFSNLQASTNPNFTFSTRVTGTCGNNDTSNNSVDEDAGDSGGVSVVAGGSVGPFDYDVIEVDAAISNKGAIAVEWLETNNYYVGEGQEELISPYLDAGMNLIAFRLQKDKSAGAIRPIAMTYEAGSPMIPIKLTAVAADDNMGVLVWVVGPERAVPVNYRSLYLNEAAIDWFDPGPTYNDVVNLAADEAGGQGFVTEFSGNTEGLVSDLTPVVERGELQQLRDAIARFDLETGEGERVVISQISVLTNRIGAWDGFEAAFDGAIAPVLGDEVSYSEFVGCERCFEDELTASLLDGTFNPTVFADLLELEVFEPLELGLEVLGRGPKVTRLYTTMSADEMTLDPLFDFNADLGDVDNVHNATLFASSCDGSWRMQLHAGGEVSGDALGRWPFDVTDMPANARIAQLGTEGEGEVVQDNTTTIRRALQANNVKYGDGVADEGCACTTTSGSTPGVPLASLLVGLGVLVVVSRRRRVG